MKDLLGQRVRDTLSTFSGIVTGQVEYITGCHQYLVHGGITATGDMRDPVWIDAVRLEIVPGSTPYALPEVPHAVPPGFDRSAPVRS